MMLVVAVAVAGWLLAISMIVVRWNIRSNQSALWRLRDDMLMLYIGWLAQP